MRRIVYEVVEDMVKEPSGKKRKTFSILIKDDSCILRKVYDAFTERIKAEEFVNICNREQVELIHFDFVLEEWIIKGID